MSEATMAGRDAANWFEIPAEDLDRAVNFYERLLGTKLTVATFRDRMAMFPASETGVGGAIVCRPQHKPGATGPLVYLNADGVLEDAVKRVGEIGGSVLVPVTVIPGGFGSYACVVDSEANHVGLHQH